MTLYCIHNGYKCKVGELNKDIESGEWVFIKNKPILMKIVGKNGGYGIQKEIVSETGKVHDIQDLFRSHPNTKIIIIDSKTGKTWYSRGQDWLEHQHAGNYGDGKQVFLSVDYMTQEGKELWK